MRERAAEKTAETIHAGCVLIGEAGVLIRGAAGAGKSTFARELVLHARHLNLFTCLVSDDRTRIEALRGRIVARPVEAIAGHIEVRGAGIMRQRFETAAVLRLIVDLSPDEPPRHPDAGDSTVTLCGVMLPRLRARTSAPLADIVIDRINGGNCDALVTV